MLRIATSAAAAAFALALPGPGLAGWTQSFQQTGHLGLEVTGAAGQNSPTVMGTLGLSSFPPGGVVQRATLYASQNNNGTNPLTATFNGAPLGAVGPSASDAAFNTLYTYQWDVTSLVVPPANSFPFTVSETVFGLGIAGVGLVVVWQDPAEPMRTVTIIDGMKQVGESGPETESITFTGLPSGATKVWIFTVYDDSAASGEVVTYDNANVGGPIDGNLGLNASAMSFNGTSSSGNNALQITTGADHMGWMVGATAVDMSPVGVEPRSWGELKSRYR